MPINPYASLLKKLTQNKIKFVVIGVSGINYYADDPGTLFSTRDLDILVQPTGKNVYATLRLLEKNRCELESNGEPVVEVDQWLTSKILEQRAVITARKGSSLRVDIVTDAGRIPYEKWRKGCRYFLVQGVKIPVGGLPELILAKKNSNREKDRQFLALYRIQLKEMLEKAKRSGH
ncbi:MAG: hypothetical protein HY399_08500 [Elusimicrobia bacterium]|nr:hypothetical protein [Elusimicrobiota bacterium]